MYFVIFDTCSLLNNIHDLPEIPSSSLSSISFLIFIIKSCFTKDGLPLLGLSFSPSIPLSLYLLYHLYAHALDLCNSCATVSICCLSVSTRLTRRILSFTSASYSYLYALSSVMDFN